MLQLGYFAGTATWTYFTLPFALVMPGFVTMELPPWEEHGQRWRRLRVGWPDYLATHSAQQTLYVDDDGLLARHDYDIDINARTGAADYVSDYVEVAGIKLPSRQRVFPRAPDGGALDGPLMVSIDLSEIAFA
jgi:hypothetical protein